MKNLIILSGLIFFSANTFCAMRTSPDMFMEGSGVTNCGDARIANDAQNNCREYIRNLEQRNPSCMYRYLNYRYWNADAEYNKRWDGKRSCKYRATYKCEYKESRD